MVSVSTTRANHERLSHEVLATGRHRPSTDSRHPVLALAWQYNLTGAVRPLPDNAATGQVVMKRIGTYNGLPVYEDPNCPLGQMYFMNDHFIQFGRLSRWQRLKLAVKRWMTKQ